MTVAVLMAILEPFASASVDLVVSNPPYIRNDQVLQREIRAVSGW